MHRSREANSATDAFAASHVPLEAPIPRGGCAYRQRRGARASRRCHFTGAAMSWPDLSGATHHVLERRELLNADRAPRVQAAGGDADLGAHAELAAVGELGGGIVQQNGAVEAGE